MNGNIDAELEKLFGAYGDERARLVALLKVTRAVETLNTTSSRLSKVNIGLTVVMAAATLVQLWFLCPR
jgi:hypothetical protein